MKNILTTALAILAAIVLTAFAVCIGSVNGWRGERDEALSFDSHNADLTALVDTRAMDAANLAVVAARHLPEDDKFLTILRDARDVILSGKADMASVLHADAAITDAAAQLARSLPTLATVQAAPRDTVYISMLTSTLTSGQSAASLFEGVASNFNSRMQSSLTGRLAMLLGVNPLEIE